MKKADVEVGAVYQAKISGRLVPVKILGESSTGKGWKGLNLVTDRQVTIKSAQKLRRRIERED